ncbi:MAG: hypothetical protein OQL09_07300 [Gammaproteobacteria bacterium]|nr:hypothetical protein [Gammaproteobacteria bacterium]
MTTSKKKEFDDDIESFDDDIKDEDYISDSYPEQKLTDASPQNSNARRSLEQIFEQRELERQIYDDFAY